MNNGITRINITGNSRDSRMMLADKMKTTANRLYFEIFTNMGILLKNGENEIQVSKQEFLAGYDYHLGIDVILTFWTGQEATLQEKFLQTNFNTVTIEYYNDSRTQQNPGDWFNIKATYYFVGYWLHPQLGFERWILLDWPAVQRATAKNLIPWQDRTNQNGHAQASFKFVEVKNIPDNCILAKGGSRLNWYTPGTIMETPHGNNSAA